MINWEYNPKDYGKIEPITPGDYRVRIEKAEEQVSKSSGKDMIKLTLKVSGHSQKAFTYIVFDNTSDEGRARTNRTLRSFFDSFGIEPGNFNTYEWEGKVGAVQILNETYNGTLQTKVGFFIYRDKQDSLPAWQENPVRVNPEMVNPNDNDCPF